MKTSNRTKPKRRPCELTILGPLGSRVSYKGDELSTVRIRLSTGPNALTQSAVKNILGLIEPSIVRRAVPQIGRRGGHCRNIRPSEAEKTIRAILEVIVADYANQFGDMTRSSPSAVVKSSAK